MKNGKIIRMGIVGKEPRPIVSNEAKAILLNNNVSQAQKTAMVTDTLKVIQKQEVDFLTDILRKHLGREPTPDDGRLCQKATDEHITLPDYYFAYNGKVLGKIHFELLGAEMKITFTPSII